MRERPQWLTARREMLLQAAFLDGEEAVALWREWAGGLGPDDIEEDAFPLLPLVYEKLAAAGAEHPLMGRLKGIQRYTWYENQIRLKQLAGVLGILHDAGIETLILKGAALVLCAYKHPGLRTMRDFDVLVPPARYMDAVTILRQAGWTLLLPCPEEAFEAYLYTVRANAFRNREGIECDLHMHAFPGCRREHADDSLWESPQSVSVHGVPARVLSPARNLLHVCAHAAQWRGDSVLRQIADAMTIVNTAPGLDWDRFVAETGKRHQILPVRRMLRILKALFDAPIPGNVLENLEEAKPRLRGRVEYALKTHPAPPLPLRILDRWLLYRHYLETRAGAGLRWNPAGFIWFLQRYWRLPRRRQVFAALFRKSLRILLFRRRW
jgi:hypothetical protein